MTGCVQRSSAPAASAARRRCALAAAGRAPGSASSTTIAVDARQPAPPGPVHRDADVGRARRWSPSARALGRRLPRPAPSTPHAVRFDAGTPTRSSPAYDVVVDGSDNFADQVPGQRRAVLAGRPLVHGAAVALGAQLLTVPAGGRPCYRCLFEAPPAGRASAPRCAEAGVLGPVPGVIGALRGSKRARLPTGETPAFVGRLVQYDSRSMLGPRPSASTPTATARSAARRAHPRARGGGLRRR